MLSDDTIKAISDELSEAERKKKPIEPLVSRFPEMTIDCAYKIQLESVRKKVSEGQRIVGKKIGLTSYSMQKLLGVYEPDYGHLLDTMVLRKNELSMSTVIQPKGEGEIAFVMKEGIKGPGVTSTDVIGATDFLVPAIEIIDSRVRDWKIKIEDTVADNASSAFMLVGARALPIHEVDMFSTGMVFSKNGDIVNTGAAAAVMGSPLTAVTWLVNKLAEFGAGVRKGEIILSGALTAAVDLKENDVVEIVFDRLGGVILKVVP